MTVCNLVSANRLLAALPVEDYQRLLPYLQQVSLPARQVLHETDTAIDTIYFPERAIVSLVSTMQDGSTIEVGLVGSEGVVGSLELLGSNIAPTQAIVQVAGTCLKMSVNQLKLEFRQSSALQNLILRYVQALYIQVTQNAACNRLHCLEARLARWLLTVHDRVQTDEFPLTQEFIAQMLGTRRAGVTIAAQELQQAGIIRYSRGNITILNRSSLEAATCECYDRIKTQYRRLLD